MAKVHPDCINASNPYHECVDYCYAKIAEAKERADAEKLESEEEIAKKLEERTVHPDCVNALNPYHECSEYCFRKIVEAMEKVDRDEIGIQQEDDAPTSLDPAHLNEDAPQEGACDDAPSVQNNVEQGYPHLNERQKKLFELRLKMNEARKANQTAMVAEKKKMEDPAESRGISKQKWMEERKKKIGKLLDSNGLDMTKAYMLDSQETAEAKYKKWEKDPAPSGWDVFNQKTLYNAYKKRRKNIACDMKSYIKAKEADPEFYRDASSLQYGKLYPELVSGKRGLAVGEEPPVSGEPPSRRQRVSDADRVRALEDQLAIITAERAAFQADAEEQRQRAEYAETELARYQSMGPRAEGSSSSVDFSQVLHDITQERDTLLTQAQGLRVETVRLLEVEGSLQAKLAAARQGDERVRMAEERAQIAVERAQLVEERAQIAAGERIRVAEERAEQRIREVEERARLAEAEISQLRVSVIQLQGELLVRRSRSAASISRDTRLRQLEEQLQAMAARTHFHSRSVRQPSMSEASAAPRAAMPPPPDPVLAPAPVVADDEVEGVGTSAPPGTQDDTPAS